MAAIDLGAGRKAEVSTAYVSARVLAEWTLPTIDRCVIAGPYSRRVGEIRAEREALVGARTDAGGVQSDQLPVGIDAVVVPARERLRRAEARGDPLRYNA